MMTTEEKDFVLRIELICIALLLSMSSCTEQAKDTAPEDLIPKDEFVEILVDLNLIEAVRSMHVSKEKKYKIATEAFYNELWKTKDISEDRFKSSFEHYRKDPVRMAEFYELVAEQIKRKEDLLNEEKRNASQDSSR